MNIGQRIRYFREKLNMSQAKLAELVEMEAANINRIENGKTVPILETLIKICNALSITPNDLLILEYNAPKSELENEIASLMEGCPQEEYKKVIEYINFIKTQRK